MIRAALVVLGLLAGLLPAAALAAALEVRTADRVEPSAPSVSAFPAGASSVVAVVGYRELGPGTTIDVQLLNANGSRVAGYREPVPAGGAGTAAVRLLAPAPLAAGSYTVSAAVDGAPAATVPLTVGGSAPVPGQPAPGAPGSAGGPAPVQVPRAGSPTGLLASNRIDGLERGEGRFGLANVLPDGAAVPGVAGATDVPWMSLARRAGANGNRWELRWDRVEPTAGGYDWSESDRVVAANEAAGMPLLLVLIGTPPWAGEAAGAPPRGLAAPAVLPDGTLGDNPWAKFVHAAASRYRGRVHAYEIWNEPNRPDFWRGTPAEYYRLLSVATASIRHADAGAQVVFGGLDGYRDAAFLERVLDAAVADDAPPGRRGAFDALAWHAYHRPIDVYLGTLELRERLRGRGLTQPIWVTETNVPAWDDRAVRGDGAQPYRWSATEQEQAAYVLEALGYAVAAGVERVYFYRASDTGEAEAWGLLRADGTTRLAEQAFRLASGALAGATRAWRAEAPGLERIVVERPGERVTLLWATGPADAPAVFEAVSSGTAKLFDKIGGAGEVAPRDGRFVLSLPGASANQGAHAGDYPIGGDPYVLVERLS